MVLFVTNGRNCQILTAPNSSFQCTNNLLWSVYSTLEWVSERGSEKGRWEGGRWGQNVEKAQTLLRSVDHALNAPFVVLSSTGPDQIPILFHTAGLRTTPFMVCIRTMWTCLALTMFSFFLVVFVVVVGGIGALFYVLFFFFTGNQRVCTKPDQRQHFLYILHHFAPVTASEGRDIGNVGDRQGRFFMEADMICILSIIGTVAYICLPKFSSCDASPEPILFKNLLLAQPATMLLMPGFRWKKNMSLFWSTYLF